MFVCKFNSVIGSRICSFFKLFGNGMKVSKVYGGFRWILGFFAVIVLLLVFGVIVVGSVWRAGIGEYWLCSN